MTATVALKRELHYRQEGRDVHAVQRALHRTPTIWFKPDKPTSIFGDGTVKAVKGYQKHHNLDVTGHYDRVTHHHLVNNPAWDGMCDYLMRTTVLPNPDLIQRQLLVSAFMSVYARRPLHYSMGADRDDFLDGEKVLSNYPIRSDCSGTYEWCYWVRGLPQPSNLGWRVLGYTGSMVQHGKQVNSAQLKIGDAIFYGGTFSVPEHVVMYIGKGLVLSRGSEGGPQMYPMNAYRTDFNQMRTYF